MDAGNEGPIRVLGRVADPDESVVADDSWVLDVDVVISGDQVEACLTPDRDVTAARGVAQGVLAEGGVGASTDVKFQRVLAEGSIGQARRVRGESLLAKRRIGEAAGVREEGIPPKG